MEDEMFRITLVAIFYMACSTVFADNFNPYILKQVAALSKNAKIITSEHLDEGCGKIDSPGYIAGDFNGDSIKDYAVLAVGMENNFVTFWYLAFLGKKQGGFQRILLAKYQVDHLDKKT